MVASRAVAGIIGGYLTVAAAYARIRSSCLGVGIETYGIAPYPYTFTHRGSHC